MSRKEDSAFIQVTCARNNIDPISITKSQIDTIGPGNFKTFVQGGQIECHIKTGEDTCVDGCQISRFFKRGKIPGIKNDKD